MCIRDRSITENDIHAKYENGILTLDVPKEEAKKVVFAGKSKEKPVKAQKSVNKTGEKISTITFRCTVKEHNFKEVNARLSLVQKVCEEFKIIDPKEEL